MNRQDARKEQSQLNDTIIAQWKTFSGTDAYKDWMKSMDQYMALIQDNVDNMTENRPGVIPGVPVKAPIDSEKAMNLNQRKVGVRFSVEYVKNRVDS